jgi:hypothetical protein
MRANFLGMTTLLCARGENPRNFARMRHSQEWLCHETKTQCMRKDGWTHT